MKKYLYVLMLTIMVVVMSEFQTAGMMPQIAADLGVSTGQVGTVVTLYALGMALGGPLLVYLLRHRPPKASLLIVIGTYAALEVLVPLIHEFWWLALLRVLTGCLSGAAYGIAVSYSARLAPSPEKIGEAVSIVLGGIMIGTVIGLPLSHFLAARWGWQSSFYILGIAAFAVFLISLLTLPAPEAATQEAAAQDLRKLRSPKLWSRYLVSLLTIGAAFAGFSYFTPLLEQNAGFATNTTTLILLAYGIVSFIGNLIVGKFADQHAIGILRIGHTLLFISLALLGAFSNAQPLVLAMVLIVGVAGVPMNPALVARVAEIGGTGNMVSTVHTSLITMGVALGSAIGALAIGRAGDDPSAAMWIGAAFAVLATLTLATQARGRRQPLRPPHATETVDCV
ncbi:MULTISPECIES: MFS transporter [unclassified Corynebacterium]|uniref:MFS transporter n=1 Tax=unclassified Corynebacterium TaxID=2624378 RepID=UPI00265100A3|nr:MULTISPECIES: MFS transporter [unclassified Corynebacterium]MDN8595170.1 MFS transporter [Corynebacterium sp. P4_F2]WKK56599.1 MFS transporter [Corynebacterium sp. P4-C1]WKK64035.1 MFS transporter [Corynebacterium sp. P8-C1]